MMNTPTKKLIVTGGALVVLVLVSCGLTGCNWFGNSSGSSNNSATTDTSTAEIPGLPPDPGEAGKATIAGVDSDNDGVRDDVQIAIFKRYPNDTLKRNALTQGAKTIQDAILVGEAIVAGTANSDEPFRVSDRMGLSAACMVSRFSYRVSEEDGFLESAIANTRARGDAYVAYNGALSGQSLGSPDTDTPCQ